MIRQALAFIVLLLSTSSSVNAQDIVFPGPTDRPDYIPLHTTRFPNNPNNPNNPNFPNEPTNPPVNGDNYGEQTSSVTPNPNVTTQSPGQQSTPSTEAYNRCIRDCLATSEYNPICGSDGVVYSNPGRLDCAKTCGKSVEIIHYGQCIYKKKGA